MNFDALMGELLPDEQVVVRWMLDAVWPDVSNSIEHPAIRFACNLLLQSPRVPLGMRPPIERMLREGRYEQVVAVVIAGLMIDEHVRAEIERRYRREPWPKLGLFPEEWSMGERAVEEPSKQQGLFDS